ncbi:Protein phosphatase 2C 2 [Thoreauomyces humboldtii]|nr:Protein phosphatase 2C 2 [Thoreauomyces humboldtii]
MGQTLSEPVTEKHTTADEDERIAYGASAMQGWRISMEDAHTTILRMPDSDKHISFFAVFDGHGGSNVAKYSGQHVHERVAKEDAYAKGDYAAALKAGFLGTDVDLRADERLQNDPSGCTAVAALITDDWRIFVSNAGDSRAVLSANGTAVPLSFDHKPVNPEETQRIVAAGGFVEFGRVNGNLALSRAIGDFEFKQNGSLPAEQQIVTVNPDITERKLLDTDEFVVVACDGIWDCMSNQEVVDFVRQKVVDGLKIQEICEAMMTICLALDSELGGVGCDNMTVVIVALLKGRSTEQWAVDVAKAAKEAGIKASANSQRGVGEQK